jgi:hypothetical protein
VLGVRPAPDAAIVLGALLSLAGYLLPWFRLQSGYSWSFSGWAYASLSTGGGWTLINFVWITVTLIAGLWARRSSGAATVAVVGGICGLFFALAVVAVSFAEFREQGSLNWVGEMPFDVGLPVLAAGLGLVVAGGVRAIVRTTDLPAVPR